MYLKQSLRLQVGSEINRYMYMVHVPGSVQLFPANTIQYSQHYFNIDQLFHSHFIVPNEISSKY